MSFTRKEIGASGKKLATVVIDLDDVRKAGSVEDAIHEFCKHSDGVASGVHGMEFSTSGPGSGWSRTHGINEFSAVALSEGATAYVDATDGKAIHSIMPDDDTDAGDILTDIGGCEYVVGDWSDESEVYVECPDVEEAIENAALVAEMAKSVIDHHHALSDTKAWRKLIEAIQEAAEAFSGIDADELPSE